MSQITRCPACATMFKVGAGQFEAAQGWVRCGCCGEVFDAAQHLVPTDVAALKDDAAPAAPAVPFVPEDALEALPESAEWPAPDALETLLVSSSLPAELTPASTDDPFDSAPVVPEPVPQDQPNQPNHQPAQGEKSEPEPVGGAQASPALPPPLPAEICLAAADASSPPVAPAGAEAMPAAPQDEAPAPDIGAFPSVAALTPSVEAPTEVAAEPAAVETNPVITPLALLEPAAPEPVPAITPVPELSFVRDAQRKAFWKRPLVRVLLGLVFLLLLTALLLQWVLQQKDNLAATDPRLAPFLQALCGPLNCTIRPPRRIESLLIDSSSFRKTGPDMYSLSFVLKNNSAAVLEMPSLEVTLTDIQEQALVRRVLAPREFGATTAALAAHGELAGVITLKVAGEPVPGAPLVPLLPVTGYRVVAFYP